MCSVSTDESTAMSPRHDKKCLAGGNLDAFFSFSKKYQTFDEFETLKYADFHYILLVN